MDLKRIRLKMIAFAVVSLLQGCGGKSLDAYERLEQPPQIITTPSPEVAAIDDETITSNGLGSKIILVGSKATPTLKLNVDFDHAWLLLGKVLHYQKILVTDHDREQGQYLVTFDTSRHQQDTGFFAGLSDKVFGESYGLRKYQLTVKQASRFTIIVAKDIGEVTTEANPEDNVYEVVDAQSKGPEDTEWRILSGIYKNLRDGFVEAEIQPKKGFLD